MRIAVLGLGAIGGLISALLWKNGNEVFCIGTNRSVKKINSDGIQLRSKLYGDFIAKPIAQEILQKKVDVLIIAVKAPNLLDAIQKINISSIKNGMIVPLINGTGFQQIIKHRLGEGITVAGNIGSIEVTKTNYEIKHLSLSQPVINIGSNKRNLKKKIINFSNILNEIGVSSTIFDIEAECTWTKLIRLNAIATLTSAFQVNIGEILNNPSKNSLLNNILLEGALVAEQDGVSFDVTKIKNQISNLNPSLSSSMQRDISNGLCSEINHITGGVINLAKRYNISVPAHLRAYKLIQNRVKEFQLKN